MDTAYVAFDLETTGLDQERDSIIEIGAVRFTRSGIGESFSTLVNPRRSVSGPVLALTGIDPRELEDAPPIEVVARDFEDFMRGSILVGHNICNFDLPVLDAHGIRHPGEAYDTHRIATVLQPSVGGYALSEMAAHYGIEFPVQHRGLADAEVSMRVLLALFGRALELPTEVLAQIAQWLTPTSFPWRGFFREAWEMAASRPAVRRPVIRENSDRDLRPLKPVTEEVPVAPQQPLGILASAARREVFEAFDERAEQKEMLEAVVEAFNHGARLMVEAGTGTGKSMAYLIPAACLSEANSSRVVVSTSTINLQEQLTKKDIPAMQKLMPGSSVMTCQLKGRRNYLCLRRFDALRHEMSLSDDDAYLASRVLVWLGETETGDRGELRLWGDTEESLWSRISADRAECTSDNSPFTVDGSCFLLRARKKAEASHIVVVNHALLLSDIGTGGRVVPPYEHLVIDEAHHLEDEATRQFGFSCREKDILALLDRCEAITPALQATLRSAPVLLEARQELATLAGGLREAASAARPKVQEFGRLLSLFLAEHSAPGEEQRLHITRAMRVQPDWADVEIAWDNARVVLSHAGDRLQRMFERLSDAEDLGMLNQEMIVTDIGGALEDTQAYLTGLSSGIEMDDPQKVVWLEIDRQDGGVGLSWVPLQVHDLLRDGLYKERKTVILTGATLRTPGGFTYLQERLGLDDCETLALGSPFDYRHAAMILVPRDMPEPASPIFTDHMAQAIIDLARASRGRALVLFTSYAMLRAAHQLTSGVLQDEGITVLGQGIDGSPRQLVRQLRNNPESVILGTSSFWEGVDIPGDTLSLLVIARLPFAVPTDPVYAARAEQYDDPFNQYALPLAVIRFKQGFGRLIRTKTDRGVLVVLDQRIVTKEYGRAFLQALPQCPIRQVPIRQMPDLIDQWLSIGPRVSVAPGLGEPA